MNEKLVNERDMVVAVLLNYNQNDYTLRCIESLLKSSYANFKVLLVDNGSDEVTAKNLEINLPKDGRLEFRRLVDNIGYGQGTNYGLSEADKFDPEYMLILNNDTIIDPDAITELVSTSKFHGDKVRVTGKVYHYEEPEKLQFIAFEKEKTHLVSFRRLGVDEMDTGQYDSLVELDMIDDIFVLQPAELYRTIGGYSPFLWINGVNIDLSLRALENGYKLMFSPKAKIWHKGSVSFGGRDMNPKMAYLNIQSKLIIRYLHLNKIEFFASYLKIVINDVFRTCIKSIYYKFVKGKDISKYAMAKIKALNYFNKWVFKKNNNTGEYPV